MGSLEGFGFHPDPPDPSQQFAPITLEYYRSNGRASADLVVPAPLPNWIKIFRATAIGRTLPVLFVSFNQTFFSLLEHLHAAEI
jgi:hypothetical protein